MGFFEPDGLAKWCGGEQYGCSVTDFYLQRFESRAMVAGGKECLEGLEAGRGGLLSGLRTRGFGAGTVSEGEAVGGEFLCERRWDEGLLF